MYKVLALLRTLYLVFAIGYTVRAMPVPFTTANTFDEQYARCAASLNALVRAAWLAVGWIALETVVGWVLVRMADRRRRAQAARTATAPPPPAA